MVYGAEHLEVQRTLRLRSAMAGDFVAAVGVREVSAGSDVASIRTRARTDGGDYLIDASKMRITNGTPANFITRLDTGEGAAHEGEPLAGVPLKTKGIGVARTFDKRAMRRSERAGISFQNVRVPQHFLVGEESSGFAYPTRQFQEERMWAIASSPAFVDRAIVQGQGVMMLASMGAFAVGRSCCKVSDACLQFFGGMGFMSAIRARVSIEMVVLRRLVVAQTT